MANLSLDGTTKVFDDGDDEIVAVNDIDLEIEDGEFVVLVGPSGCGKSTTLRMIAGLDTPTSGTISIGGEPIQDKRPQERDIAMVFQSYALYPHMTVRENMSFGLEESTDMSDDEIRETVEDAAETLGITPLLDRKPGALSGGQQQRVALGRAIVRNPEVFLLDEPLSNLDAKLRAQMRTELQQLQNDLGVTTMYVTHDQTEAMTMGDRIAILNDGELQQLGTPMECYHEPSNVFVAGFLGEPAMNFFDLELDGGTLRGDGFDYALSPEVAADVDGHTDVTLGIRPESVDIIDDIDDAADEDVIPATVEVVEPHGDENAVHLRIGDETDASLTVMIDGMRYLSAGQEVGVRFPEDAIHLFDGVTGEALHNRKLTNVDRVEEIGTAQSA
ncbi:ABC transporter ATP-binding protein [Halosimplex aquaticum]|uniref:ABC-type D-xylose/L-arabinose transporter n=1 Tax=Halosimplex aquaticum TaxID=3026162 RepID=A0ABD5XVR3_9EURY|nr:ABC transporter ATP-binding protein [Halosimplex aquaticum]